jgi:sec-independent protein translocase protein TatB
MSFADTVVLFVLALLLFGPKKLPGIARQIGKALNEFKRASNEFKFQIEAEISQLEYQERQKKYEEERKSLPAAPPAGAIAVRASEPSEFPPPPQEGGPVAGNVNAARDTTNA